MDEERIVCAEDLKIAKVYLDELALLFRSRIEIEQAIAIARSALQAAEQVGSGPHLVRCLDTLKILYGGS